MDETIYASPRITWRALTRSATAERFDLDNTPSEQPRANLKRLANDVLERVIDLVGVFFDINSGYRGPLLNKKVGGSPTSQHCNGEAADIEVAGLANVKLARLWTGMVFLPTLVPMMASAMICRAVLASCAEAGVTRISISAARMPVICRPRCP